MCAIVPCFHVRPGNHTQGSGLRGPFIMILSCWRNTVVREYCFQAFSRLYPKPATGISGRSTLAREVRNSWFSSDYRYSTMAVSRSSSISQDLTRPTALRKPKGHFYLRSFIRQIQVLYLGRSNQSRRSHHLPTPWCPLYLALSCIPVPRAAARHSSIISFSQFLPLLEFLPSSLLRYQRFNIKVSWHSQYRPLMLLQNGLLK
jgi:hypothetical protein